MTLDIRERLTSGACLPDDAARALLVARIFDPAAGGPTLCRVDGDDLRDLSALAPTAS
jgi:fumarylacetoacetate (FAA) hydrolase family protein